MLYYSGIRAAELVGLDVQSVSLRERTVRVLGKGNKERIIPFTVDCQKVLKEYIDNERKKYIPLFMEWQKKQKAKNKKVTAMSPLFFNAQGGPLTTRGLEYILDEKKKKFRYNKEPNSMQVRCKSHSG